MNTAAGEADRPLRIAIDGTPLSIPASGIRRYVEELVAALALQRGDDRILVLSDQPLQDALGRFEGLGNVEWAPPPGGLWRRRWWSLGLPRMLARLKADVFHGTDFAIPYLPVCPTVLTIHDLSPWKPAPVSDGASARVRQRTPGLVRLARRVITPSAAIRREVMERFGAPRERVRNVPLAPTENGEWLAPRGDPGIPQPYILFLTPGVPRKNFATALAAWRELKSRVPELNLAVAGRFSALVATPRPAPGLYLMDDVPDWRLAALLSGATAIVYPSLYEGFGLPVLEAMRFGTPVIASTDPALTETCGGAALQANPYSVRDLRDALLRLIQDSGLAQELRQRGIDQASRFRWSRTAELTRRIYVEAILAD